MTIRRIAVNVLLITELFLIAKCPRVSAQDGPTMIRFNRAAVGASDAIIIPCHVLGNHGTAWTLCLLDTGASTTIVDNVFSGEKAKDESISVSADGTKTKVHQERLTITLPTIPGPDLQFKTRVCVMGLRLVVPGVGVILGEDFLRRYKSVQIDYARNLLILSLERQSQELGGPESR